MKITKITELRSIVINIGNFQNMRFEVSAEAEVEKSDDIEVVKSELHQLLSDQLWMDIQPTIGEMPTHVQEQYARWLNQEWIDPYPPIEPLGDEDIPF